MNRILVIFISLLFLTSCGSSKDAFTLKKKSSIDEFLVEKKNPLVLPPEFGKLPVPQGNSAGENDVEDEDIKNKIIKKTENSTVTNNNSSQNSLEKLIIEKINN